MGGLPKALQSLELPTTTVRICVRPDLVQQYERLNAARPTNSLADATGAQRVDLERQMEDATITLTLRGLPRRRWTQLLAEHPAQKGNKEHEAIGYNADSFHDALLRESVIDPVLDDEAWERLDEVLTQGHWQRLWLAAQSLNITSLDLPFG